MRQSVGDRSARFDRLHVRIIHRNNVAVLIWDDPMLEEIREVKSSPNAEKADKLRGFDFTAIRPMEELEKVGDGKIVRWLQHRFPRQQ